MLDIAQGRRRHLLDEKSHGDVVRMNSIIGGERRIQQPEPSGPSPRGAAKDKRQEDVA